MNLLLLFLLAMIVTFFLLVRMSFSYRQKVLTKQKKLLDCRLKLDEIAYKMEEKLLNEEFCLGAPCHDIWFPIVNKSRYADKYFSMSSFVWYFIPTRRKKISNDIEEIEKEVQKMHPEMKKLYDEYQKVLFEAFKIRHSVIFKMFVVIAILKLLPQIFKAIKASQEIQPDVDWPKKIVNLQLPA